MEYKAFPDTNILMHHAKQLFDTYNDIKINGFTLEELDELKESTNGERACLARSAVRIIEANEDTVDFIFRETGYDLPIFFKRSRMDNQIINILKSEYNFDNSVVGISNDLIFRMKCKLLRIPCIKLKVSEDEIYTGYKVIDVTEDELANWYASEIKANVWDLRLNEYGLLRLDGNIVEKIKRTKSGIDQIKYKPITNTFSNIKLKPRNIQQELAFDMLQDQTTHYKCLTGCFGSGKDLLMINTALQLLEEHKYEKIVWVVQNYSVKDTKDIGALPGTLNEKLMPFTNILSDKLGSQAALNMFVSNRQIEIVPLAYIRGRSFDKSILMLSEAENVTKEHMQLIMSRIGEKSMLMINGDFKQTDSHIFKSNSGLKIFIDKLKGHEEFGYVMFEKTERSKLADMANMLD